MSKTQCPYCHESIDNNLLASHIEEHRQLLPDGQQKDYVTLPPEERYDNELKGVPVVYEHSTCGVATCMPDEIVRSYLKNPYLYLADTTFCAGCGKQVPNRECKWEETGENVQTYFDRLRAAKPECRPAHYKGPGSPAVAVAEPEKASGFSLGRVGMGLVAILVFGALAKLPRAVVNNAAQPANQQPQNNQAAQQEEENWSEKIKRGEDVPEPILMLAGIKPEVYKLHQVTVKAGRLEKEKQYAEAVQTLDAGLADAPEAVSLHNSKAWILATCEDEKVRNGKMAVDHATKACELTEFSKATYVDTLAAAHAEAGEFDAAVKQMQNAMELTEDPAQRQRFAARLELYKNHQPYHQ